MAKFCLARVSRRLATASTSVRSLSAASNVLIMGLGGPKGPPPAQVLKTGLTKEKIMAMLKEQNDTLRENGVTSTMILIDYTQPLESNAKKVTELLTTDDGFAVVAIGAGVRTYPEHCLLFETLINLVHEHAPEARIAFNTGPGDTAEAVLRQLDKC
jgi:hypothetical protein